MNIKDYVSKQASEWIGGIKKFLSFPYGPEDTPQEDYQLINKQYADTGIASLSVSISNLFSSVSASLGAISSFLTNEVIWSSTCNRLVVSTTADPAPTEDDIWIDMSRVPSIVSTTTDYELLSTNLVLLCNASGGAFSISLGTAANHAFRNYYFKKIDNSSNRIAINPNGTETIDASLIHYLTSQNETLHIGSDAVNWYNLNSCVDTYITPSDITLSAGVSSTGYSVGDVNTIAGANNCRISESTGTPGFNLIFDFSNVYKAKYIFYRGYYVGSNTHYVLIDIYNYTSGAWDTIGRLIESSTVNDWINMEIRIPNASVDYISSSNMRFRIYHVTTGSVNHYLFTDYAAVIGTS